MTQLLGASRIMNTVGNNPTADEQLQNMLMLYKTPATIRDMKQTFFYVQLDSEISQVHPLRMYNPRYLVPPAGVGNFNYGNINLNEAFNGVKYAGNPWYLPIGTTRKLDISKRVNELLDIRVPKDKYVVELNLVECNIESDASGWRAIPDYVFQYTDFTPVPVNPGDPDFGLPTRVSAKPTYRRVVAYTPLDVATGLNNLQNALFQATKLSQPETLFCRIRELDNGEPYNWSVTNTGGVYSVDKNHQLLVLNRDIDTSELTLEFGHMSFVGLDYEEKRLRESNYLSDQVKQSLPAFEREPVEGARNVINNRTMKRNDVKAFGSVKYFDFNSEVFNVVSENALFAVTAPPIPGTLTVNEHPSQHAINFYPDFYRTGVLSCTPASEDAYVDTYNPKIGTIQPINRPPFFISGWDVVGGAVKSEDPPPSPERNSTIVPPQDWENDPVIQGVPFKTNQQVRRVTFRFLIRILHMF
jgi:hypothetical protein